MLPIVKLRLEAKTIECFHFEQLPSFYRSVINVTSLVRRKWERERMGINSGNGTGIKIKSEA